MPMEKTIKSIFLYEANDVIIYSATQIILLLAKQDCNGRRLIGPNKIVHKTSRNKRMQKKTLSEKKCEYTSTLA